MQYFPGAYMHTKSLKVNNNCNDCLVFLDDSSRCLSRPPRLVFTCYTVRHEGRLQSSLMCETFV